MERCLFPARIGISVFIVRMMNIIFPNCTLTWRVKNYVSRQGKVQIGRTKLLFLLWFLDTTFQAWLNTFCSTQLLFVDLKLVSFIKENSHFSSNAKLFFVKYKILWSSPLLNLFSKRATLENSWKIAAMSKETQEYPKNNQLQNSFAPGINEEYIGQVSAEIEGLVT